MLRNAGRRLETEVVDAYALYGAKSKQDPLGLASCLSHLRFHRPAVPHLLGLG